MEDQYDLDLGLSHYLRWFTYQGAEERRVGALIYHPDLRSPTLFCISSPTWENEPGDTRPLWNLEGSADEHITLTPSIRCGTCGDHGFVRDGKWVAVSG